MRLSVRRVLAFLSGTMDSRTLLIVVALALAGCSEFPKSDPAKSGPFFAPSNVTTLGKLPAELRRVAILPVSGNRQIADVSLDHVDQAIGTELTRTGRFETVVVSRDQLQQLAGVRSLNSTDALPVDFLQKLAKATGADGVLLSDVTHYSPYPPLLFGFRVKLARLPDGEILWAADNVFNAADPSVANAARRYNLSLGADRGPGDLSHTVLQNPSRFAAYVASATFQTLPPR